jgi:hypothetical protein
MDSRGWGMGSREGEEVTTDTHDEVKGQTSTAGRKSA